MIETNNAIEESNKVDDKQLKSIFDLINSSEFICFSSEDLSWIFTYDAAIPSYKLYSIDEGCQISFLKEMKVPSTIAPISMVEARDKCIEWQNKLSIDDNKEPYYLDDGCCCD